jgi:hypothetical protein
VLKTSSWKREVGSRKWEVSTLEVETRALVLILRKDIRQAEHPSINRYGDVRVFTERRMEHRRWAGGQARPQTEMASGPMITPEDRRPSGWMNRIWAQTSKPGVSVQG